MIPSSEFVWCLLNDILQGVASWVWLVGIVSLLPVAFVSIVVLCFVRWTLPKLLFKLRRGAREILPSCTRLGALLLHFTGDQGDLQSCIDFV